MATKRITAIAVFVALIIVGGLISVLIPFTTVQLSFQTVFVLGASVLLGGIDGAICSVVYLIAGLMGLPVFTQGGGVGYVFTPSFGYLIGFPIGAFVCGLLLNRTKKRTRIKTWSCMLMGLIPIYGIGVSYYVLISFYYTKSTAAAILSGVGVSAILLIKDIALCLAFASISPTIERGIGLGRFRAKQTLNNADNKVVADENQSKQN